MLAHPKMPSKHKPPFKMHRRFLFLFPFFYLYSKRSTMSRRVIRRRDRLEALQSEQERWMSVNCGIFSCCQGRGEAASEEDMKEAPRLSLNLLNSELVLTRFVQAMPHNLPLPPFLPSRIPSSPPPRLLTSTHSLTHAQTHTHEHTHSPLPYPNTRHPPPSPLQLFQS